MHDRTAPLCATPGTKGPVLDVAGLLERAADALWIGEIRWGQEHFITPVTSCRCVLGAIGYALDPADVDGNPVPSVLGGWAAEQLAHWLVERLDGHAAGERGPCGDFVLDPIETVGEWNDRPGRVVADVVEALRDAAADYRRQAAKSAR